MKFLSIVVAFLCLAVASSHETGTPHGIRPRQQAPGWKAKAVSDETFVDASSDDHPGKWKVLMFYPFDWTFVCPTELQQYSDNVRKFLEVNTVLYGISTDSHHTHLAWIKQPRNAGGVKGMAFPLVADISKSISRNYGVLVDDPEDGMYGAALRGLFIIDPKNVIRSVQVNDDHVGRNVEETLRLIRAFQYADENGEVCPASWQPGDRGMKPSPAGVKEYMQEKYSEL